jgi:membrane protease YdiL (CAAX protease family)
LNFGDPANTSKGHFSHFIPSPGRAVSSFRKSIEDSNAGAYLLVILSFIFFAAVGGGLFFLVGLHYSALLGEVLGILGAALLWRWAWGKSAAKWPSFRLETSLSALIVAALTAIALGLLASTLATLLIETIPGLKEIAEAYVEQISELIVDATGWERAVGILSVCVAAPICEELLFRGTILQEQRKAEKATTALVINGILFAAFHINPISGPGLAILGAFLAHITIRSGSVIPAIVAHAAINTTNAVIMPAIMPSSAEAETAASIPEILMMVAGLAALSALLWWGTLRLMPAAED